MGLKNSFCSLNSATLPHKSSFSFSISHAPRFGQTFKTASGSLGQRFLVLDYSDFTQGKVDKSLNTFVSAEFYLVVFVGFMLWESTIIALSLKR